MTLLERLLLGTNVALGVLQERLVLLITLVMTCGLFCAAMWLQTQYGIIIAAAWALLVFLPVLLRGERHAAPKSATRPESVPAQPATRQPRRRPGGNSVEERDHARAAADQPELDL